MKRRNFVFFIVLVLTLTGTILPRQAAGAQTQNPCTMPPPDVATPLTDLGSATYTRMDGQVTTFTGGLYPGGSNQRPAAHESAGRTVAAQIRPRNAAGQVDAANGRIGFISIGMSNTWMEFQGFITRALQDPATNPRVEIINGAIPGHVSSYWIEPDSEAWQLVAERVTRAGLTPAQVQVAWIKLTQTGPGAFPAKAQSLQNELGIIVRNLKAIYPNTKIAYLSSRTNSYTVWQGLSPEPAAYETGFAYKWLIESQMNGAADLNYNPSSGPVVAPYLTWGPYLWINSNHPRSDGQVWLNTDMVIDCTHPSDAGVVKIAAMLLDFFKTDSISGWFTGGLLPLPDFLFYLPWIFRR